MNASQKDAWLILKKAVDKYSQTTGAEVKNPVFLNTGGGCPIYVHHKVSKLFK